MKQYTITRKPQLTIYSSPFFHGTINHKNRETVLTVIGGVNDAFGFWLDRKQFADLLRRKFKNHVDRKREMA